jgi:hypothetical protein
MKLWRTNDQILFPDDDELVASTDENEEGQGTDN